MSENKKSKLGRNILYILLFVIMLALGFGAGYIITDIQMTKSTPKGADMVKESQLAQNNTNQSIEEKNNDQKGFPTEEKITKKNLSINEKYLLQLNDDENEIKIYIFDIVSKEKREISKFYSEISHLPKEDVTALKDGIIFNKYEDVLSAVEDFSS